MLSVICFSKDRPLQVDAYIESLMYCSNIKQENIYILYLDSENIKYDKVIQKFKCVNWIRENNFYTDLLNLVEKADNYILWGCDDVYFKGAFDVNDTIEKLVSDSELFGFSLRLGANLNYLPNVKIEDDKFLKWNWSETNNMHWNYPWEVSGSIFRKDFVLNYIKSNINITNPNRFEAFLANYIQEHKSEFLPNLICFIESKCLTLTINRVQDEYPNDFDASVPSDMEFLQQKYLQGYQLDWHKHMLAKNKNIHEDALFFSLTNITPDLRINLKEQFQKSETKFKLSSSIKTKIIFWKYAIFVKEKTRPFVPRNIMQFLRNISK